MVRSLRARWTGLIVAVVALIPAVVSASTAARNQQLQAWQQQYQQLPAAERQRIQAAWRQYQQLPLPQQQQLQRSFSGLDQLHRTGWRLGPRLGRHWPGLQPLFAYVDPVQREALLQLLHGLDEPSLQRLIRLAQRTAPEQRQVLRDTLLQQPAAHRAAWLRQQAGS